MTTTTKDQYGAYAPAPATNAQAENVDPRDADRIALMNCTARLSVALRDGGQDMAGYVEAIRHNQKLWTMFQVALCDPDNALPRDLKVTLLNLSRYVDRTSFRAVTEFAPQLLNSLINVNRAIATGLAKKQGAPQQPAPSVQAPPPPPPAASGSVMTTA